VSEFALGYVWKKSDRFSWKEIKTLSLIRKLICSTLMLSEFSAGKIDLMLKKRLFADSSSLVLLVVFKISESKKLSISKKAFRGFVKSCSQLVLSSITYNCRLDVIYKQTIAFQTRIVCVSVVLWDEHVAHVKYVSGLRNDRKLITFL
jgi:hypothetical protein